MRIGVISTPWTPLPPPAYGGIEGVVDRLARGFIAAGHEVLVAAPGDSQCPARLIPDAPPADVDGMGLSEVELGHVVRAYNAMPDMDLVHDHTLCGPLYRHRPPGLPIVTTNHGPFRAQLRDIYQAMGRDVSLVAISHHQASTANGVPIARVIHHGIDVDSVPIGDGSGGYACFLGRMNPSKGVREAAMVAREAGIPLRIAAKMEEKGEREYFECAVSPLLNSDIEYLGEVGTEEKYELLGGACALLNPMQWPEPFGLVMIEALAAGTPVIATPAGSAPEIINDGVTGFLREDIAGLASSLGRLGELSREACREAAVGRFSTERMVADHLDLYAELIGAERPARPASGTSSG
ncbi:glycosyltransferase family 4 protein [Rugosimonospora acidiphila]|uniref:Glycosyltransferase family 4 protein n=1 Tax=Rugosimonospora acidiphila TaxID=556531 RepID=A0ABP9SLB7_9ACTN